MKLVKLLLVVCVQIGIVESSIAQIKKVYLQQANGMPYYNDWQYPLKTMAKQPPIRSNKPIDGVFYYVGFVPLISINIESEKNWVLSLESNIGTATRRIHYPKCKSNVSRVGFVERYSRWSSVKFGKSYYADIFRYTFQAGYSQHWVYAEAPTIFCASPGPLTFHYTPMQISRNIPGISADVAVEFPIGSRRKLWLGASAGYHLVFNRKSDFYNIGLCLSYELMSR